MSRFESTEVETGSNDSLFLTPIMDGGVSLTVVSCSEAVNVHLTRVDVEELIEALQETTAK